MFRGFWSFKSCHVLSPGTFRLLWLHGSQSVRPFHIRGGRAGQREHREADSPGAGGACHGAHTDPGQEPGNGPCHPHPSYSNVPSTPKHWHISYSLFSCCVTPNRPLCQDFPVLSIVLRLRCSILFAFKERSNMPQGFQDVFPPKLHISVSHNKEILCM